MLFLLFNAPAFTQESLLKNVRDSINRIKPFKVDFVQQVYDEDQLEIEESGEVIYLDQDKLKWTYLEPDFKVFLLEKDTYKFYDQENEQLTIGQVKEKNRQWIWQLLFSDKIGDSIKVDESKKIIHIKDDKEAMDIEIQVDQGFLPVKAVQNDPSGARLVYLFKNYKERIAISDEEFNLKVPEDVDVVME